MRKNYYPVQKDVQKANVFVEKVQKAVSRGLHVPGGATELGGPTASRAQMSKVHFLFLLVYLSDRFFTFL